MEIIILEKSSSNVKKPLHQKKNIFIIYCPRVVRMEPATSTKIDTKIVVFLPQNSGDDINDIYCKKQLLLVEILNKSFEET